ncbi:MAG: nucleotide sugar dehydrogenase [Deltaproteobacteria bacterium]
MDMFSVLKDKINKRQAKIGIIGLGYVGLPLAVNFGQKGFFVYGYDTDASRVSKLENGEHYIVDVDPKEAQSLIRKGKFRPTTDEKVLSDADVIIICVPTPLRKVTLPDISYVVSASRTILRNMRKGQLIILESTSYTTTTREVVLPILAKSGLRGEKDFFLCFSPERVNPGDKQFPVTRIPKAVGGLSQDSTELAFLLYSTIMEKVFRVSSPEVAETSKLLENTFRLVNIALINEFAIVCNKLGISIWEVIECAKTKPFGFMPFYPGPGIGGHCIPCDPVFLSWKAKKLGFKTKMIDIASQLNRFMPVYVTQRAEELVAGKKKPEVLVLGVAYKKDVKDLRESPALEIIEGLLHNKMRVGYYDPFFPYLKINGIDMISEKLDRKTLKRFDLVILVTDHTGIDYDSVRRNSRHVLDTRNTYKGSFKNVSKL